MPRIKFRTDELSGCTIKDENPQFDHDLFPEQEPLNVLPKQDYDIVKGGRY